MSKEKDDLSIHSDRMWKAVFHVSGGDKREFTKEHSAILDRRKFSDDVQKLSKVSAFQTTRELAYHWSIVAISCWAAIASGHWAVYVLAMFIVATRQHAIGILVHDACHHRLFPSRKWNDILADLFAAFPVGISTSLYRKWHFPHHRHVNGEGDPEWIGAQGPDDMWTFPKTKRQLLTIFLRDLVGFSLIQMSGMMKFWSPWSKLFLPSSDPASIPLEEKVRFVAFNALGLGLIVYFGLFVDYLILWLVPNLTLVNIFFKYRAYSDHKAVPDTNELNESRTVIPTPIERFVFSPCHVNYHIEHHLFPSVPFYNLPKLHDLLMQDETYRTHAHITHGYLNGKSGLLYELTTPPEAR